MNFNPPELIFSVSRESLAEFGKLIYDGNPLHRDKIYAAQLGFSDTPVQAVFLEGLVERIINHKLLELHETLLPQKFHFFFREPVYPDENIAFFLAKDFNDTRKVYQIESKTPQRDALQAKVTLAQRACLPEQFARPIYETKFALDGQDRDKFYNLLEAEQKQHVAHTHIASFVTAALLRLIKERTGRAEGFSRSISIDVYNNCYGAKEVRTTLALVGKPKPLKEQGYLYHLEGVCYTEGYPTLKADMNVIHQQDLTK